MSGWPRHAARGGRAGAVAYDLTPVFEALNGWAEQHAATLRLGDVDGEGEEVATC